MEGTRLQKVERLIQKDIGEIFQLRGAELFPRKIITVTRVRVSPDLSIAKIYISIFPSSGAEDTLANIIQQTKTLRLELGKRVRHQLRIVPDLSFFIDDSLDYIDKIDNLLK